MRALPIDPGVLASLDRLLHEPARLAVIACLSVVEEADFVFLQSQTGITGGNLSSHLRKLEDAGYLDVRKEFNGNRPRTVLALTGDGRAAFAGYVDAMRQFFDAFGSKAPPTSPRKK